MTPTEQAVEVDPVPADFDECFRLHYPRLVRSLALGSDDADAAVQEAFVQAHLRWRMVSQLEDPVGWVRRVAIRRILNQHRGRRRRDRAVERLGADQHGEGPDPADDRHADLVAAIRTLPARQRLALVLHHLDGLPVREVAAAMDTSEGTVKSQLHDARANLRPLLEVDDV
ncbi:MAG: RNA polymerase sigma factor [Acidimicrobiales bacterium]